MINIRGGIAGMRRTCRAMQAVVRDLKDVLDLYIDEDTGDFTPDFFEYVLEQMRDLSPTALAEIAICGQGLNVKGQPEPEGLCTPLSTVHDGAQWIECNQDSGLYMLQKIAATAVVAHLGDLIARALIAQDNERRRAMAA